MLYPGLFMIFGSAYRSRSMGICIIISISIPLYTPMAFVPHPFSLLSGLPGSDEIFFDFYLVDCFRASNRSKKYARDVPAMAGTLLTRNSGSQNSATAYRSYSFKFFAHTPPLHKENMPEPITPFTI